MLKNDEIGVSVWKFAVALYLIANGVLGILGNSGADFIIIFRSMNIPLVIATIISVIALIGGILVVLEIFTSISSRALDYIALGLAIIWAVYIIIGIISWITNMNSMTIWHMLQRLGVHTMVLGSLLIIAKKGK
ncbi:MAG: hypothetical protein FWB83_02590 [Treponema sp.]|nr:hypothetical protein [Treponema sp.]